MRYVRVLVTGAGGQLADAVMRVFADRAVLPRRRSELDVADAGAVMHTVEQVAPEVIVNCAAFNDVDGAESRPAEAFAANAFAVRNLVRAADRCGALLVHYGTDFVFDGTATEPYNELAVPSPRSTYAASKLVGEWLALEARRSFVLRVESLFGTTSGWNGRKGTLDKMVEALEANREVPAFTDRIVSPSYVEDIAAATRHLADNESTPGLYHCVNSGGASWYEVALEAARLLGVEARIRPVSTDQVVMKAARPRFCALSNVKLAEAGFQMPSWQDAMRRWLSARARTVSQE